MPRPKLNRICQKDGCSKRHKARGLCDTHYTAKRAVERRQEMQNKPIYARNIDFDDYWLFVKKELGIK